MKIPFFNSQPTEEPEISKKLLLDSNGVPSSTSSRDGIVVISLPTQDFYRKIPAIKAAVNLWTNTISAIPLTSDNRTKDTILENNGIQGLMRKTERDYFLTGNAFWRRSNIFP